MQDQTKIPRPTSPPVFSERNISQEHDSCALVMSIRKRGEATHGNLKRALAALGLMGHRGGEINGEGDGCGVMTDIPRRIWAQILEQEGKPGWLAEDRRFFVGHLMIPKYVSEPARVQAHIHQIVQEAGLELLIERQAQTWPAALGKLARQQAPLMWQIAGLVSKVPLEHVERTLFNLALKLESETDVHVASLSSHVVVYKVRGTVETLYQYYPELRNPDFTTSITIAHSRYSTNTATTFERVQPFSLIGHNGEINTIARLREQTEMLGIPITRNGSDSQDLDRIAAGLIHRYYFSLLEAMEILFPPIPSEIEKLPPEMQTVYAYYRQAFGPFAQGPAAIIARYGDECVVSVDALGLRPLWYIETDKEYVFASEKGVYHLDIALSDPVPLSPGEKMCVRIRRGQAVEVLDYPAIQQRMVNLTRRRFGSLETLARWNKKHALTVASPTAAAAFSSEALPALDPLTLERRLAVFGWGVEEREWVNELAEQGTEVIASLGYDGPLPPLSSERQNVADYFKETVAVVTNPAIDRERETEHFSTQVVLGSRPPLTPHQSQEPACVTLETPFLLDHLPGFPHLSAENYHQLATQAGTMTLETLLAQFPKEEVAFLDLSTKPGESVRQAHERLVKEAIEKVRSGIRLLILDDTLAFQDGKGWVDSILILSAIDRALRAEFIEAPASSLPLSLDTQGKVNLPLLASSYPLNLRRQVGLVLRSGAIRSLHDAIVALGMGADALAPYLLYEVAVGDLRRQRPEEERKMRLANALKALRHGIEKSTSTMGIHEMRGYGRLFASIGLRDELAAITAMRNYFGSQRSGLSWEDLDREVQERMAIARGEAAPHLARPPRFYPKVWKAIGQVARGEMPWEACEEHLENAARLTPVTIRHVLGFRFLEHSPIYPTQVDLGVDHHSLPFVIASMSFGSQGETAFRAYAEAAYRLNMLSITGEGGELLDIMGHYPHNRGVQIASGRFGITAELLNSCNLIEIKIGQGAKPGEGGHLPGRKVTPKIAATRHSPPGIDLISPSNNHDIYSIEDLAQFIEELKTINPKARVAVKVPVVIGIGIIAVGIAKAGADIIYLAGYEGGTGAARKHSIRYVGLPVEIGLLEAHRALIESGLRSKVEIWADGGVRSAADAVKLMCLGANRVGFGTMAMVALGCTICRKCQTGTCHVGITTQIETVEQAQQAGIKHFVPREMETAVQGLERVFSGLGEEMRKIVARLGFQRAQDLVGRVDLLEQVSHHHALDLSELLTPVQMQRAERELVSISAQLPLTIERGPLRRPRNHLTTVISNLVMETALLESDNKGLIQFEDEKVSPVDRVLGTHLSGALVRFRRRWDWNGNTHYHSEVWHALLSPSAPRQTPPTALRFYNSSVPGNGLGAYNVDPVRIVVEGGAQDGVAKGISGGRVVVLKGYNHDGKLIDGSVGKGLAYGGTGGLVIVQGNADSRACIRLSGADVIIGGEIKQPLKDHLGYIGARANVKGFLCEYMTAGRVLVLGDPGPWMCSGMTGGVLYLRLQSHLNFDLAAIHRRLARGAKVKVEPVTEQDFPNLRYLLTAYAEELSLNHQHEEANHILELLTDWQNTFVRIVPESVQENQHIASE